jgi:hypothetical protein
LLCIAPLMCEALLGITVASLQTILTANTAQHDAAIAGSAAKLGVLQAEGVKASTGLNRAFSEATTGAQKAGVGIGNLIPGVSAATLGIGALAAGLIAAGKAAMDEQVGINRLTQALQNNIPAWNGNTQAIEAQIAANQRFAFSDDQLRDSLAALVTRTHDVNKAFQLQATAMDFARGRNIDLQTATNILGKVYDGNIGILARYGVAVQHGATVTEALGKVQQTYSGQAQKYGDSTAGSVDKLKIAFDNAMETIGTAVLPLFSAIANALSAILPPIADVASALLTVLKPAFDVVGFIIQAIGTVIGWLGDIFHMFTGGVADDSATAGQAITSFGQSVDTTKGNVSNSLSSMTSQFNSSAVDIGNAGANASSSYGSNLTGGIDSYLPDVEASVGGIYDTMDIQDAAGALGEGVGGVYAVGSPGGVTTGLDNHQQAVYHSASSLVGYMDVSGQAGSMGTKVGNAFGGNAIAAVNSAIDTINRAMSSVPGFGGAGLPRVPGHAGPPQQTRGGKEGYTYIEGRGYVYDPFGELKSQSYAPAPRDEERAGRLDAGARQRAAVAARQAQAAHDAGLEASGYTIPDLGPNGTWQIPAGQPGGNQYMASDGTYWPTASQAAQHSQVSAHVDRPSSLGRGGGGGGGGGGRGAGGTSGRSEVETAIKAAMDETKAISDAINQGVSAISKLGDFKLPAGFDTGVEQFAQGVDKIMMRLQQVSLKFKSEGLAHILEFTTAAKSGMDLVSSGADALAKLKDFQAPAASSVDSFLDSVQYVTNKLGDVAKHWSVDSLAFMKLFSESTGSSMDMVSKAVDSLSKLKDFQKPSDLAMQSFVDAVDYLTDKLRKIVGKWDAVSLEQAAKFGQDTGEFVSGIGKAVDVLKNLVDFKRPADQSIDDFFSALDKVTQKVSDRSRQWYGLINKGVAEVSGYVGQAVTGMLAATDGLSKLGAPTTTMPTEQGVDKFFDALDLVAPKISDRSRQWYGLVNKGIAETAGYVGSAVTGVLGAVDGLVKLSSPDAKMPGAKQVNEFFDALDKVAPLISDRARQWYGLINEGIAKEAGYVGQAVTGILSGVDPIMKLADFKPPTDEAIDSFFKTLDQVITAFDARAASFQEKAGPVAADVATRVGVVAEALGKAFDPLLKVADVQAVTKEEIEGAMANVWELLNQTDIVMKGMPADFLPRAQAFGTGVSAIFTAIKTGFDVASSIGGETGGSIGSGFDKALSSAQSMVGYIEGAATTATKNFGTDTHTMRDGVVSDWDAIATEVERDVQRIIDAILRLGGGSQKSGSTLPEDPFKLPPLKGPSRAPLNSQGALGGGGNTTVLHNPVIIRGDLVPNVTEEEHDTLVRIGRHKRRRDHGLSVTAGAVA